LENHKAVSQEASAWRLALGAWPWALGALPLAYLWWLLINQLRIPWSTNPQYAYGWAVPLLCAYLVWRRVAQASQPASSGGIPAGKSPDLPVQGSGFKVQGSGLKVQGSGLKVQGSGLKVQGSGLKVQGSRFKVQGSRFGARSAQPSSIFYLLLAFVALLYAPTRLVQEANPEWGLVSWALALEVIALTLLTIHLVMGQRSEVSGPSSLPPFQLSAFSFSAFVFPICFFLVAVPWPYLIENPVIQGLTRLNTALTIEILGWLKIPALQHGNVIELRTGEVGIDEACSGIRSLQATLMLSLFFGELYRLKAARRALLVLSGFGLAFLFNLGRTTLLTWVAARDGMEAISHWHDPAGVTILVGCFLGLWLSARALRGGKAETLKSETLKSLGQRTEGRGGKAETLKAETLKSLGQRVEGRGGKAETLKSETLKSLGQRAGGSGPGFRVSAFQGFSIFLAAWLVVVEIGVALWYRHIEAALPAQPTWQVAWPAEEAGFRNVPIPQKATEMLRYDEAKQAQWTAANGTRWQLAWFYWKAGKAAGYLAKSHNPLVCMPAVGYSVSAISPPQFADLSGLRFPFRLYTFEKEGNTLYVLYSRWDDRAAEQSFATEGLTGFNRLRSVWRGRGNHGQRVIGLALWGVSDAQGAREQLLRQLQQVLVVNPLR
jgi:exosortase/archaeosortase family protein